MRQHTIGILGGGGFVGRHLCARLARDRHRLRVLTRRRESHRELLVLPTLDLIEADVHDPKALEEAFAGCDTVINLVGILNERGRDGSGFFRAHVELPRKVVAACRTSGVHRLLHMSALGADAAYGMSHYQRTKGEGEAIVHGADSIQATSFRPSVIFGPGDSFFTRFAGLLKITPYFFPLACPNTRYAPVYVGDVVEAFVRAIDNPATFEQRYDLCGPRVYTLKELVEYTARLLGLRRRVVGLGKGLSRLEANVLEWFPGKPFSRDNYLTMQRDNVCTEGFAALFAIAPATVESIVPTYIGPRGPSIAQGD